MSNECLFKCPGERIHAQEYREVTERPASGLDLFLDKAGDGIGFAALVVVCHHFNRSAFAFAGCQFFGFALLVVGDEGISSAQDVAGASVII